MDLGGTVKRIARGLLRVAAWTLVVLLAAILLLPAAIRVTAVKRLIVAQVEKSLNPNIAGSLVIDQLGDVSLGGRLAHARVRLLDRSGRPVLIAWDVTASIDVRRLISSLLDAGPIQLSFSEADVGYADLRLDIRDGAPAIARVFESATPSPQKAPATEFPVSLSIESARVQRAWVHGQVPGIRYLDSEATNASGALSVTKDGVELDGIRGNWRVRPVTFGLGIQGSVHGAALFPMGEASPSARAALSGTAGGAPFDVRAQIIDDHYRAIVDLPRLDERTIRRFVDVRTGASLSIRVSGSYEQISAEVSSRFEGSRVEASLAADFESGAAHARASFEKLDLALLFPALPSTRLDGRLTTVARHLFGKDRVVRATLHLDRSTVAHQAIPSTDLAARWQGRRITGSATLHEPGAPTALQLALRLAPDLGRVETVRGQVHVDIAHLERPEIMGRAGVQGGHLDASASVDLDRERVSAEVSGRVGRFALGELGARDVSFSGRARGPLADFRIEGHAAARRLRYGDQAIAHLVVDARGTRRDLDVSVAGAGSIVDRIRATAEVSLAEPVLVRRLHARVQRRGVAATVRARRMRFDGGVAVQGFSVDGIGRLDASGRLHDGNIRLEARGQEMDLAALGRAMGVEGLGGRVSFEGDLHRSRGLVSGRVDVQGADLGFAGLEGFAIAGRAQIDRGALSGVVTAASRGDVVRVGAEKLRLQSVDHWRTPHVLERLEGTLEVYGRVHPDRLQPIAPSGVPSGSLSGIVAFGVRVAGRGPKRLADIDLFADTQRLAFSDLAGLSWPEGVDAHLRARLTGSSREATIYAGLDDSQGQWARFRARSTLPAGVLDAARGPGLEDWLSMPVNAKLFVKPRHVSDMPEPLSSLPIDGVMSARLRARGRVGDPRVSLSVRLLRLNAPAQIDIPLDTYLLARHEDGVSRIKLRVSDRKRTLAAVRFHVEGTPAQLLSGDWTAGARAKLNGLPLSKVALLSRYGPTGKAYGRVALDGFNEAPRADAELELRDLRIGRTRFDCARGEAHLRQGRLSGSVQLDEPGGGARATVKAKITSWPKAYLPKLDLKHTEMSLTARSLQPGFVLPFVGDTFTKLDGRVDADLHVTPGSRNPLSGTFALSDGIIQAPTLGQTFHDVTLRAKADGDRLRVTELSGRGLEGRFAGKGSVELEGLSFRRAKVELSIPKNESLPLTIEGVAYGKVWGRVVAAAKYEPDRHRLGVDVTVPRLELTLSEQSARSVQSLGEAPHVMTGVYEPSGEFKELPLQLVEEHEAGERKSRPTTVVVNVELGKHVLVKRPTQLEARFTGNPVFETAGGKTTGRGQIQIVGGWLDVLGKRFTLEQGTVTFQKEALDNPVIVASARWDSPGGTTVRAEFRGPVKSGKLTLSSSPPLSDSAILSLLVLGTTEGTTAGGAEAGGVASGAAAVGGGLVTRGLDKALTSLTHLEITTRIDTSENTPRPEVMVRVTRRLAIELSYNPYSSTLVGRQDHALLTFTFTLPKSWALETTVGDAGTSIVDLIWRHRY